MVCKQKVLAEEIRGIGRSGFMAYADSVPIHPENSTAPGEDEALCEPRERASAILGIVAAFVLGLCVVLAAIFAGVGRVPADVAQTTLFGSDTSIGVDIRNGTGRGLNEPSSGAGADVNNGGKFAEGPDEVAPPPGSPDGAAAEGESQSAESVALAPAGPEIEPPTFGFTQPDAPPPPPMIMPTPPSVAAPGVPTGRPPRGGSGAAGGGSTEGQIIDVVQAWPDSRISINLDATGSMAPARNAVARVIAEIFDSLQGGSITVTSFRDVLLGEPNEVIIKPTLKTKRSTDIQRLVQQVLDVEPYGGGDSAETGYQLVIANMKKRQHGTAKRPNIEFIVTDAEEKQPELLKIMRGLMRVSNTRVFIIRVDSSPPTRTEIK
jgi:hypothetical protein